MKITPHSCEIGEMLRREQLALIYWANIIGHYENYLLQTTLQQCHEKKSK